MCEKIATHMGWIDKEQFVFCENHVPQGDWIFVRIPQDTECDLICMDGQVCEKKQYLGG